MDRIKKLNEFLKDNPTDSFVQHALALEYIKLGNDADAKKLFETILDRERIERLIREKNALVFTFWCPGEPYKQIDMFLTRENSFDGLVSDARMLTVRGRTVLVASREKLIEMAKYPKLHLHVVRDKSVVDGVDDFVTSQKADLLTMFTHRLDFKEKLLGKSVTRKIALHNTVPLLTFNKTN